MVAHFADLNPNGHIRRQPRTRVRLATFGGAEGDSRGILYSGVAIGVPIHPGRTHGVRCGDLGPMVAHAGSPLPSDSGWVRVETSPSPSG